MRMNCASSTTKIFFAIVSSLGITVGGITLGESRSGTSLAALQHRDKSLDLERVRQHHEVAVDPAVFFRYVGLDQQDALIARGDVHESRVEERGERAGREVG